MTEDGLDLKQDPAAIDASRRRHDCCYGVAERSAVLVAADVSS
jgi:hypothetical protein